MKFQIAADYLPALLEDDLLERDELFDPDDRAVPRDDVAFLAPLDFEPDDFLAAPVDLEAVFLAVDDFAEVFDPDFVEPLFLDLVAAGDFAIADVLSFPCTGYGNRISRRRQETSDRDARSTAQKCSGCLSTEFFNVRHPKLLTSPSRYRLWRSMPCTVGESR